MELGIAAVIAVVVLAGGALAAVVAAYHRADAHAERRRVAEVELAAVHADLRVERGNVESFKRQVQRYEAINRSHREVNDALRAHPVLSDPDAHGLDRLLATIDAVAAIGPAVHAGGGDAAAAVPRGARSPSAAADLLPFPEREVPDAGG